QGTAPPDAKDVRSARESADARCRIEPERGGCDRHPVVRGVAAEGERMTHVALETARLTLRPPIEADLGAWAAPAPDPQAPRFIGGLQTHEQSRRGMAAVTRMWAQRGCSLFSVVE